MELCTSRVSSCCCCDVAKGETTCVIEIRSLTVSLLSFLSTAVSIPQKTAVIAMGGITLLVLIYLLSGIFWWTLFSSGVLVAIHSFLRDASMHKDMDDVMIMEGDFQVGEESSFLDNTSRV